MLTIRVTHKGQTKDATPDTWQAVADEMLRELGGPWGVDSGSRIERVETVDATPRELDAPTAAAAVADVASVSVQDTRVGDVNAGAAARIDALHDALRKEGVTDVGMGNSHQAFANGTRMMDMVYAPSGDVATKAREHAEKLSLRECHAQLTGMVRAEQRRDVIIPAKDFANALDMNGALVFKADGSEYKVREQAIRGLTARLGSPALSFFLGVRDRIADATRTIKAIRAGEVTEEDAGFSVADLTAYIAADKAELLEMLQRECHRFGHVDMKFRLRDGLGDVFASMSPTYANADAPEALADVAGNLPDDARATFSYDPVSTAWELRASVYTPTPVEEQAVGEPFEGFASFRSRDNGNGSFDAGGGILIWRCLNATIYQAAVNRARRRHVGRILHDIPAMVAAASASFHTLCRVWGETREQVIARPADDAGALIPLEMAIPGFFRHMLTVRGGELVGVLPGRTEKHVKALAMVYPEQRQDSARIVRADFAQAYTKYIQTQATPVRREAEAAIGKWLVSGERVAYAAE